MYSLFSISPLAVNALSVQPQFTVFKELAQAVPPLTDHEVTRLMPVICTRSDVVVVAKATPVFVVKLNGSGVASVPGSTVVVWNWAETPPTVTVVKV